MPESFVTNPQHRKLERAVTSGWRITHLHDLECLLLVVGQDGQLTLESGWPFKQLWSENGQRPVVTFKSGGEKRRQREEWTRQVRSGGREYT